LRRRVETATPSASTPAAAPGIGLREQLRIALRDRSYWMLHLGFFTCGFHIAFLVTHLPGEIAVCGLSDNVSAMELEDERIVDLLESRARALGFVPQAQTLEVHGLCADCVEAKAAQA
jgi:hypothetical protein